MRTLDYEEINRQSLRALKMPGLRYFGVLGLLGAAMVAALALWLYQINAGMGVSGLNIPVGWGVYIADYVFWVAIAMSGTVISAMLYLVRSKFRNSISRSAEAMAVFAVAICALFPAIHLGRFWVSYYLLPYPSQRQIWPNFKSPLIWDVWAIITYLITTWIFYFVGLIPDLAIARDWGAAEGGVGPLRTKLYQLLAGGWNNMSSQWHHYKRSYLYFAALATPLAVSIHTVTSWDFSMGILPGWHTTIYGPYFVAGAVFSGMAMALTFIIPMRRLLHLEELIPKERLEPLAKIILFTSLLLTYSYVVETFMEWYTGKPEHRQFIEFQATGWIAGEYWLLWLCNALIPLLLLSRRIRANLKALFVISLFVNVGMWVERLVLTTASTAHDFLPHNWGGYVPTPVELGIVLGAFSMLFFGILVLNKLFPPVPIVDLKEEMYERKKQAASSAEDPSDSSSASDLPALRVVPRKAGGLLAVFAAPAPLIQALQRVRAARFDRIEVFSPFQVKAVDRMLYGRASPVRWWTLAGVLIGLALGFVMPILTAEVNRLIVGGKTPAAHYPYWTTAFEVGVLVGVLFNLAAISIYANMFHWEPARAYDPRFARDKFGLFVACAPHERARVADLVDPNHPEELHVVE